jgi:hypothetical protein
MPCGRGQLPKHPHPKRGTRILPQLARSTQREYSETISVTLSARGLTHGSHGALLHLLG